jgi:cation transport ATPase
MTFLKNNKSFYEKALQRPTQHSTSPENEQPGGPEYLSLSFFLSIFLSLFLCLPLFLVLTPFNLILVLFYFTLVGFLHLFPTDFTNLKIFVNPNLRRNSLLKSPNNDFIVSTSTISLYFTKCQIFFLQSNDAKFYLPSSTPNFLKTSLCLNTTTKSTDSSSFFISLSVVHTFSYHF